MRLSAFGALAPTVCAAVSSAAASSTPASANSTAKPIEPKDNPRPHCLIGFLHYFDGQTGDAPKTVISTPSYFDELIEIRSSKVLRLRRPSARSYGRLLRPPPDTRDAPRLPSVSSSLFSE